MPFYKQQNALTNQTLTSVIFFLYLEPLKKTS